MGTGTDVAMNSAQFTLVKGDLRGISVARHIFDAPVTNMKQNLGFAFVYNALGIPLAAGVLFPFPGLLPSPDDCGPCHEPQFGFGHRQRASPQITSLAMILTPGLRKFLLTAHVAASVGWLGALTVFLAHSLAGLWTQQEQVLHAASIAMGLTAWRVIMPLSVLSLVTGLTLAPGSAWVCCGITGCCSSCC